LLCRHLAAMMAKEFRLPHYAHPLSFSTIASEPCKYGCYPKSAQTRFTLPMNLVGAEADAAMSCIASAMRLPVLPVLTSCLHPRRLVCSSTEKGAALDVIGFGGVCCLESIGEKRANAFCLYGASRTDSTVSTASTHALRKVESTKISKHRFL
jgi:hypothetical protein